MSPERDRQYERLASARPRRPVNDDGVSQFNPRWARRVGANSGRLIGIRVVAIVALWLMRRMPTVGIPIRVALFLSRVLPVSIWLLRYVDQRRPVAQPAPDQRAAQRRGRRRPLRIASTRDG